MIQNFVIGIFEVSRAKQKITVAKFECYVRYGAENYFGLRCGGFVSDVFIIRELAVRKIHRHVVAPLESRRGMDNDLALADRDVVDVRIVQFYPIAKSRAKLDDLAFTLGVYLREPLRMIDDQGNGGGEYYNKPQQNHDYDDFRQSKAVVSLKY